MPPKVVNVGASLASFQETWAPRLLAEVNDTHVKIVKLHGDFVWHKHDNGDEMFLVLHGDLVIKFRDGDALLRQGDSLVVPRGVEHCPMASEEVHVMLIERGDTVNTGQVVEARTLAQPKPL